MPQLTFERTSASYAEVKSGAMARRQSGCGAKIFGPSCAIIGANSAQKNTVNWAKLGAKNERTCSKITPISSGGKPDASSMPMMAPLE